MAFSGMSAAMVRARPSGVGAPRAGSGRGPGSGMAASRGAELVHQRLEGGDGVALEAGEDVDLGVRRVVAGGLVGVGEEADRGLRVHQDDVLEARQRLDGDVGDVGDALDRHPAAAAGDAGVGALGEDLGAGGLEDAVGQALAFLAQGGAAEQEEDVPPLPQDAGGGADRVGVGGLAGGTGSGSAGMPPSSQEASEGRTRVAMPPGAVRAAWTAMAASRPTSCARVVVRTQAETGRAQPSVSAVSGASKGRW